MSTTHFNEHTHDSAAPAPSSSGRLSDTATRDENGMPVGTGDSTWSLGRRAFLKAAGFSVAALTVGCQRPPDTEVIPHVRLDPENTPGVSTWYASVCAACEAGCGTLVRTRDNRPVKLEGNPAHPVSRGGLCAAGQASLLGAYDTRRLRRPSVGGADTTWERLDAMIDVELAKLRERGGALRILSHTVTSPTLRARIAALMAGQPDAVHVEYDNDSCSALLDAHEEMFGVRVLPGMRFNRARTIVSVNADFLGTWISPVEFAADWAAGRESEGNASRFSWHCQIESRMSITGGKADERFALNAARRFDLLWHLAHGIALRAEDGRIPTPTRRAPLSPAVMERMLSQLWEERGASLVLCGDNDPDMQRLTVAINMLLGNYGNTLDLTRVSRQRVGNDRAVLALARELREGAVDALLLLDCNPLYDFPQRLGLESALAKVPLSIALTRAHNESSRRSRVVVPLTHALEEWRDVESHHGLLALAQPTLPPELGSRSMLETLARWSGSADTALDLLRARWRAEVFPGSGMTDFEEFWRETVRTGLYDTRASNATPAARRVDFASLGTQNFDRPSLEIEAHSSATLLDVRNSGNAWLLELPDPITKVSWDNVACLSAKTASALSVTTGDVLRIEVNGSDFALPALVQEGMADDCIAVAVGYGTLATRRFRDAGPAWLYGASSVNRHGVVGARVSDALYADATVLRASGVPCHASATGRSEALALAQEYQSLHQPGPAGDGTGAKRPCAQEITLAALASAAAHGNSHAGPHDLSASMWPEHRYEGHHWGMSIDLSACTGCSACVIACQVENNIPLVGKDEVRRNRDLQWIRVDRYYHRDDAGDLRVIHQPMMCQHCDHAPCETVCPVLATVHSDEGLNQQVYNRCVGTRYCANNCPYKVRRFNWFDYPRNDEENLVLNPDVTVRMRGVMEKCSFCIQRIQDARIRANAEGRSIADGDMLPACMQSCPTKAIRFGDMNQADSHVRLASAGPRFYRVLEELGVKPSVGYLMNVRNTRTAKTEDSHG